jgi:TatD DNase family protein
MFTDSHCHLDQLQAPGDALRRALEVGVHRVVAVAEDEDSVDVILQLKARYPDQVMVGVGLHPMLVPQRSRESVYQALEKIEITAQRADVIGEIGLDYKYAKTGEEQKFQRLVLDRQRTIAAIHKKPINLHSRWALRETMNAAIEYTRDTGLGAQLHWFTQSKKLIRLTNRVGVYVSVGPSIIHSKDARSVAASIDRSLLLLETDSPVPFDGEPAEPSWVARVAAVVADLWQCDLKEVSRQTEDNFHRYLGH